VVISIIALLISILLPSLHRVRRQAEAVGYQSNLRQSGVYFAAHAADNDGKISLSEKRSPMASRAKSMPEPAGESWDLYGLNYAYGDTFSGWSYIWRRAEGGFNCCVCSYAINYTVTNMFSGATWPGQGYEAVTDLREASNIPVYRDCMTPDIGGANWGAEPPPYEGFIHGDHKYSCLSPSVINRHDGGVNCLFMDWSDRKAGLKELWMFKWFPPWNTAGPWTKRGSRLAVFSFC